MTDLRKDRKANRQAEGSAREHATHSSPKTSKDEPTDELDKALGATVGKDAKKAYQGSKLDARGQIKTAVSVAGALLVRLNKAYQDYVDAALAAAACTTKSRVKLERIAESRRVQLAELRRTINVMSGLNAQLLKAGKTVHDADLDRLLRSVEITGTAAFDDLCEGAPEDAPEGGK